MSADYPRGGDPLQISASRLLRAYEAGDDFALRRRLGQPVAQLRQPIDTTAIKVKNESGDDRDAGDVVELGASLLTTLDRRHIWLSAALRAGYGAIGVLPEALPYNEIGLCQLAGVCLAPVNVLDADHTHCYAATGNERLQSNFGGPIEIVYKPAGTGVLTCALRLATPLFERKAVASSDIAAGASGTANVYIDGSSRGSITVWYDWMDGAVSSIANGTEMIVHWWDDEEKWGVTNAEC